MGELRNIRILHTIRILCIICRLEWPMMTTVTATEFQRQFGKTIDTAIAEDVSITQRGREKVIIMSPARYKILSTHYEELHRSIETVNHNIMSASEAAATEMDSVLEKLQALVSKLDDKDFSALRDRMDEMKPRIISAKIEDMPDDILAALETPFTQEEYDAGVRRLPSKKDLKE